MDKYKRRAQALRKHFGIFGYGHFDLTEDDVAELLRILERTNPEKGLDELYARLEALRMV